MPRRNNMILSDKRFTKLACTPGKALKTAFPVKRLCKLLFGSDLDMTITFQRQLLVKYFLHCPLRQLPQIHEETQENEQEKEQFDEQHGSYSAEEQSGLAPLVQLPEPKEAYARLLQRYEETTDAIDEGKLLLRKLT